LAFMLYIIALDPVNKGTKLEFIS